MDIGLMFWILMLVAVVFSGWGALQTQNGQRWPLWGHNVLLFVLLFCLGYKVFGPPIHG